MARFCGNCGMAATDDARVCGQCGTPLEGGFSSPAVEYDNPKPKSNNKRIIGFAIGIVAIIIVAAIILFLVNRDTRINFKEAYSHIADRDWCEIASDGSYMRLDTNPYDLDDAFEMEAWNKIEDVNIDLGFSEALSEKMGETSSLDGRQSDENDDYEVSWTYHPDSGLEVMYEKK